jgi:uracil-DNA glycosylase
MTVSEFVRAVSMISLPNVFNPYRDVCGVSDHCQSPAIRRRNLTLFLNSVAQSPRRSLWLGRDLGYRGARRTGIALTDEYHLSMLEQSLGLCGISKATTGTDPTKERTATEVWKMLSRMREPVVLWNAFPFHPYNPDDPFSNRRHTAREFESCSHILLNLIEWLKPAVIVALGADAESAVTRIGYDCVRVRHPSYGGHKEFSHQISRLYKLDGII